MFTQFRISDEHVHTHKFDRTFIARVFKERTQNKNQTKNLTLNNDCIVPYALDWPIRTYRYNVEI